MRYGFQLCNEWEKGKHPRNAIAEVKYDGMMVLAADGQLINRRQRDVTHQFPEIRVPKDVVLVGEVVAGDARAPATARFHALQRRNTDNPKEIILRSLTFPAHPMVFDILEVRGRDLAGLPLGERRRVLEGVQLPWSIHKVDFWGCPLEKVDGYLVAIRSMQGEGLIIKDLDARYRADRNDAWLKLKAWKEKVYQVLRHETTEALGFLVFISNEGREQKVAVNDPRLADLIKAGKVERLRIRYLDVEPTGALRQGEIAKGQTFGRPLLNYSSAGHLHEHVCHAGSAEAEVADEVDADDRAVSCGSHVVAVEVEHPVVEIDRGSEPHRKVPGKYHP